MRPSFSALVALLLLLPAAGCHAQAASPAQDPCATAPASCATLINTYATATTRLPNTAADIAVTVTLSGRDLITVQRTLAAKADALLSYLRLQGAQRLATVSVSFTPDSREQKNAPNKIVGYDASTTLSFRTTPDKAPTLLGGVLEHGASSVDSISFTPTEEETAAARRDLSAEATRTAVAQAGAIASAAGLHVASIRTVTVDPGSVETPRDRFSAGGLMMMKNAPAPVATQAGDATLSVSVNLTTAAIR